MARAPKKCKDDECQTRVVAKTYCDEHKPMNWKGSRRTTTQAHKTWRVEVLNRDNWTCQVRGPRCLGRATIADHILAVEFGGAEHALSNGQAICLPCHKIKTSAEASAGRARRRSGGGRGTPSPRGADSAGR